MPDETVTLSLLEDGTPDYERLSGHPALVHIKNTIDGLRGSNKQFQGQLATLEPFAKLGSLEELTGLKTRVQELSAREGELKTAHDRIAALEGAVKMTDAEKQELAGLKSQVETYAKLGQPEEIETLKGDAEYGRQARVTERLSKAARAVGYDPDAFLMLGGVRGLSIEDLEAEVSEGGKTVKKVVPHVKTGDKAEPLTAYVEREFPKAIPILQPQTPAAQPGQTVVLGSARNGGQGHAPGLLTKESIASMSAEEYEKNKPAIMAAMRSGQIK